MSPTSFLLGCPRWASVPLALAALSIVLHPGISVHAMDLVHSQAVQPLNDITPPSGLLGWNDALAAFEHDSMTDGSHSISQSNFSITPWHPRTIEYSDLTKVATIQEGRLEVVQHPDLGARPVLVKRAALPEYIESISRETEFHRLLDGLGVTPLFLGHVAEAGIITGFIAEYVVEQHHHQQHQQPEEEQDRHRARGTESCLSALRRMHGRGIAHRDAHCGNCLVREDGSAVLVDFELAEEGSSLQEFERDLWVMKHSRDVDNEIHVTQIR